MKQGYWLQTPGMRLTRGYQQRRHAVCVLLAVTASVLIGCKQDWRAEQNKRSIDGVWQKTGYGLLVQIQQDQLQVFNLNKIGCVRQQQFSGAELSALKAQLQLSERDQLSLRNQPALLGKLDRQTALPAACQQPLNNQQDPLLNFDYFWHSMQAYYAFLTERGVNWQGIYQQYRPLFANNPAAATQQIYYQQIIGQFADAHLSLLDGAGDTLAETLAPRGLFGQILQQQPEPARFAELFAQYSDVLQQQTAGLLREPGLQRTDATDAIQFGVLPGNIGYLRVDRLALLAGEPPATLNLLSASQLFAQDLLVVERAMQQVKTALAATQGLVLDLRFNPGGTDEAALAVASHFNSQAELLYGYKSLVAGARQPLRLASSRTPYLKPVRVLTGGVTTSAGEVLALALKSLPQVQLIGEPTQGSLSDVLTHQLPNGWSLQLSNERYHDASGQLLEVQGVLPHTRVYPYVSLDLPMQQVTVIDVALAQLGAPPLPSGQSPQQALQHFAETFHLPGVTAALVQDGQVSATFSIGFADIATQRPLTADTSLQVGSVSKTVIGTALALADINPAAALPALGLQIDYPALDGLGAGGPVQLRWQDLARHQSGIVDNNPLLDCSIYVLGSGNSLLNELGADHCAAPVLSQTAFLRHYLQQGGQFYQASNFAPPGQTRYSNIGTALASLAFEAHSNSDFAQWSDTHIFQPLGMTQTFWPTAQNTDAAATLYLLAPDGSATALPPYASSDYYAGTLHTSARDLATYLAAVASQRPARPLPSLTARQRALALGESDGFVPGVDFPGLFWHRSGDYVGHTGGFAGVSSLMYHNLATDTGVVVLVNADHQHHPLATPAQTAAFADAQWQLAGVLYRHALSERRPASGQ